MLNLNLQLINNVKRMIGAINALFVCSLSLELRVISLVNGRSAPTGTSVSITKISQVVGSITFSSFENPHSINWNYFITGRPFFDYLEGYSNSIILFRVFTLKNRVWQTIIAQNITHWQNNNLISALLQLDA